MPLPRRALPSQKMTLQQAMDLTMDLAAQGLSYVEPNPCVGAVLYNEKTSRVKSCGFHSAFGKAHAEVEALKGIKSAKGLTLIVSLEPCSHYGKTPPCADLVIEKKVSKLIYFSKDPNPKVSGKGLARMRRAGIKVQKAPKKYDLWNRKLNSKFFMSFEQEEAFIHLKWAQSLDAKMSLHGESKWITSKESREHSHFLRAQSQMVLVGKDTLLKDDPQLNVRLKNCKKKLKVGILDPQLKLFGKIKNKKISKVRSFEDIYFICSQASAKKQIDQKQLIPLSHSKKKGLNLKELKTKLWSEHSIQSAFVEGGAKTLSSFLDQGVFDRISVFQAPVVLGAQAQSFSDAFKIKDINQKLRLKLNETGLFAEDLYMDYSSIDLRD